MLIGGPPVLLSVHKLPLSDILIGCLRLRYKSRESKSAEVRRTWEVHNERAVGFHWCHQPMESKSVKSADVRKVWAFITWMMLWLVVMSQPLGQFGLRRLKLHLRMLTRFAGWPVSQSGVELGREAADRVSFYSIWWSQLAQFHSDVC